MTALFAGLWLVVLLMNLIGGRVIPGFTRNWLKRQLAEQKREPATLPPVFDRFDLLTTWLMVAFAILHLLDAPSRWTAVVGLDHQRPVVRPAHSLAGDLHRQRASRLGAPRWFFVAPSGVPAPGRSRRLGLLPQTAGVHALTSGAIATMILAIAGRAALGHTGRVLESHPMLTAAYVLITVAAICRVAAAIGPGARALLGVSALAWFLGFVCFAWRYVPILTQPKPKTPGSLPAL